MPKSERDRELARRRKRKVKLKKLVAKFATANGGDREVIATKVRRMSPFLDLEERSAALASAKKK